MSFILEALRKSENERQRQTGPDFASIPEATEKRAASRWPMLVAILILFNFVLLAVVFWPGADEAQREANGSAGAQQESTGPTAEPGGQPPEETPAPDQPASRPIMPTTLTDAQAATGDATAHPATREVRSLSEEAMAPATPDVGQPQPLRREQQATGTGDVASAPAPTAVTSPASGSARESATTRSDGAAPSPTAGDEGLPTANELRLQGFLTGPPLHLDLHVYYPDTSRRVVFISGNRYREGDRVKDGPVVREIVPEGVVLEERGRRFLLGPD